MDLNDRLYIGTRERHTSSDSNLSKKTAVKSYYANFNLEQHQKKWDDISMLDYGMRIAPPFQEVSSPSKGQALHVSNPNGQLKTSDRENGQINQALRANKIRDWDPQTMLNNLSFLEDKIHQLHEMVNSIIGWRDQILGQPDELVAQRQQLFTAELTSVIVQLISAAGTLLPSVKHTLSTATPSIGQLADLFPSETGVNASVQPQVMQHSSFTDISDRSNQMDVNGNSGAEQTYFIEEQELKDEEDGDEGENLPPGSYEILQLEKEEILAPHTHFCTICGKGFKRDANLRMHMRGHGDEYKTPAALAKPHKESSSGPVLIKRYSCPFAGCKRNKDHKKFKPLKTILCVKNHYKRTHCDKSYTCGRCNTKKFSVIADLKTHEKHCGKDKWLCSCGTTFSRKDKLFGHIALFQGHTPAIPPDETKGPAGSFDKADEKEATNKDGNITLNEATNKDGNITLNFGSNAAGGNGAQNIVIGNGCANDPATYVLPMNFDTCNFSGFHEFPRPPFDNPESSFSFLISGSSDSNKKIWEESS